MLLFTPGPTPVSEDIRFAMAQPSIHHRTPEFSEIFKQTRVLLKELLNTTEVLMLSSSGTGAMEACMTNLCSKKALIINSGKFGERFTKIADAHSIEYKELKYDWDTPASIDDIKRSLSNDEFDAVFLQICESAGGLRHPIARIAKAIKDIDSDIMVVADGITAIGVESIDTTNIDALIGGSQKALMLPPGLSFIGLSSNAVSKINNNAKGFYFNLSSELKKQKQNTTAFTAATTLIIGLKTTLEKMQELGFDNIYSTTKKLSYATKSALKEIGFKLYPKNSAVSMTSIKDDNALKIREILKTKYNVNIAGGQDHLKETLFRINHMGIIPVYEGLWVVNAIELTLDDLGIRKFDGTANKIFNEIYFA